MTLEQAQELRNSAYWSWVGKEIDYRIASLLNMLKACNKDELPAYQEKIRMLEELKRLPDDVVDREQPSGAD